MAQRVSVSLQDDLDGGPAAETVRFAIGNSQFEIDLSEKNARKFRQQLSPYLEHARRVGKTSKTSRAGSANRSAASRRRTSGIRAWARDHGMDVSERGRIPVNVIERYELATNGR